MSDLLADFTAEFKELASRRKTEGLSPDEDQRRKDLKSYLKKALEAQKKGTPIPEPPAELLPPPEEDDLDGLLLDDDDDDDDGDGVFLEMGEGDDLYVDGADGGEETILFDTSDEDADGFAEDAATSASEPALIRGATPNISAGKGGGAAAIRGKSANQIRGGSAPSSASQIRGGSPSGSTNEIRGASPAVEEEPPAPVASSNAEINPLAQGPKNKKFFKANAFAIGGADGLLGAAAQAKEEAIDDDEGPLVSAVDDPDLLADEPKKPTGPPKKTGFNPNAFAIGGADNILDAAASSEAVAATDPFTARKESYKPSKAEVMDAENLADMAMKMNEKPPPPKTAEEAAEQLLAVESESTYTFSDTNYCLEDYYGGYEEEGMELVGDEAEAYLDVAPVDPRDLELAKAGVLGNEIGGLSEGDFQITIPPGLAFLDDFPVLYQMTILPSPDSDEPDAEDPNLLIPGRRKVTVHMLNGQTKRGTIHRLGKGEPQFQLAPQGTGRAENIPFSQCKAVFVHLPSRGKMPNVIGRSLTVTFGDRRSVQGTTDDYAEGVLTFSLVPPAGARGNFERIIVNPKAVTAIR